METELNSIPEVPETPATPEAPAIPEAPETAAPSGDSFPVWWDGKHINDVLFVTEFAKTHQLACLNGEFYSVDGKLDDDRPVRSEIYRLIKPFAKYNLPAKVGTLTDTLKHECAVDSIELDTAVINVANGTYYLDGGFSPEKKICRCRLPVSYNPGAPAPMRFYRFIYDLLEFNDVDTVQEFIGYCLLPLTNAQKMLLIIGRGGEGKSTLGSVITHLFGNAAMNGSIHGLETSRFNTANLVNRHVMIDDDLRLDALPTTNNLKTVVTAIDPILVEKKGLQPHLAKVYCRLIGFGNLTLESLNDTSVGFFRRQIILRTKDADKGRVNDPILASLLCGELEGILLWAIDGLKRLIENNFRFSISDEAKHNLSEAMLEANNIPDFIYGGNTMLDSYIEVTATELYNAYVSWCNLNGEDALPRKRFVKFLKDSGKRYGIRYSKEVRNGNTLVRGFVGIALKDKTSEPCDEPTG